MEGAEVRGWQGWRRLSYISFSPAISCHGSSIGKGSRQAKETGSVRDSTEHKWLRSDSPGSHLHKKENVYACTKGILLSRKEGNPVIGGSSCSQASRHVCSHGQGEVDHRRLVVITEGWEGDDGESGCVGRSWI